MKSWLKKIPFIITLLAVLGGGVLLPMSKAQAQTQSSTPIHITEGKLEKDPSSDKYRFNMVFTKDEPDILHVYLDITKNPASGNPEKIINNQYEPFLSSPKNYLSDYMDLEKGTIYTASLSYTYITGPKNGTVVFSNSLAVTVPSNGEATDVGLTSGTGGSSGPSALPKCWLGPASGIDLGGCLAQGVYYALFVPTSFIFSLTGQLLDWSMAYTTDSNSYSGSSANFVEKGWKITRDIANIFFIFVLLYTAIGTILGLHSVNAKKTVGMVILIALLLNFSLLFTRIIVDASNILGNVFYNNIGTTDTKNVSNPWIQDDIKNVSVAIVSKFNPQTIFQSAGTLKLNTPGGIDSPGGIDGAPAPGQFAIVSILMAVINLVGIWVFLTVAFLFLGRVIGLWVAMIFAPIAFVSYILPDGAGGILGEMHHKKWWDTLLKQAFVVPIFLFFMYLVLTFMDTNFFADAFGAKTTTQSILGVIIPLLLIAMLLTKARKIAIDMSGEIGGGMSKLASFAGGAAVGLASGGLAFAGRNVIGRGALKMANDDDLKKRALENKGLSGKFARMQLSAANTLSKSSFDARNTGALKMAAKQGGYDFDNGATKMFNLDSSKFKGGRVAQYEHEVEHEEKKLKSYMMSGATAKTQDDIAKTYKQDLKEAKENHEKDTTWDAKYSEALALAKAASVDPTWTVKYESDRDAMKAEYASRGGIFNEAEFKRKYEKGESITEYGKTIKGVTPPVIAFKAEDFEKKYKAGEDIKVGKETIKGEKKAEFNEAEFKKAYTTARGDLSKYKVTEKNSKGESLVGDDGKLIYKKEGKELKYGVNSSKDINNDRREAYALGIENAHHDADKRSGLENQMRQTLEGMRKIMTSGPGAGLTVAATIASGGLAGAGILVGGGLLYTLREALLPNIHSSDPNVLAALRKGPDSDKELLKKLKKEMTKDEKHDDHKEEAHAPAAAHPPEPAHPPAGGGAPAHH
jgi:hypothetical protein